MGSREDLRDQKENFSSPKSPFIPKIPDLLFFSLVAAKTRAGRSVASAVPDKSPSLC